MAIAIQTEGETAQQNNTSVSQNITLGAGSDRRLIVAIGAERASMAAPSSVTFGGNAMALITDGTDNGSNIDSSSNAGVFVYEIREASMPANGTRAIAVTWSGGNVNYSVSWWLLTGASQSANVVDVQKFANNGTGATSMSVTLASGATTDIVLAIGYKNDTTGTAMAMTISGSGITEDANIDLTTGGAEIVTGKDAPAVASGTIAVAVSWGTSSNRRVLTAVRIAEAALAAVDVSGALTMPAPEVGSAGGGGTIAQVGSLDQSLTNPRNVDVPVGANLLLVTIFGGFMASRTGTYDGVALDVGYNSDTLGGDNSQWVQFLYMIDPPVGTHELLLAGAGGGDVNWVCSFWSNVDAFGSAAIADAASVSRTVTDGSLIIGCIQGTSGAHTPVSGATELLDDANGSYFAYRVEASAGSYDIGATSYSGPDLVSVYFTPTTGGGGNVTVDEISFVDVSGALTMPAPTVSGVPAILVAVSGALGMPAPTVAGTPTVDVAVSGAIAMPAPTVAGTPTVLVAVSGALAMPPPTVAGTPAVLVDVSGALSMPTPTVEGEVAGDGSVSVSGALTMPVPAFGSAFSVLVDVSGALSMPLPALEAELAILVDVSGALAMPALTLAGTAVPIVVVDVSGALSMPAPTVAGTPAVLVSVSGALSMPAPTLFGRVVDPNATEPRPGVWVTVVAPHGSPVLVQAVGGGEVKRPIGSVSVRPPRGGVS